MQALAVEGAQQRRMLGATYAGVVVSAVLAPPGVAEHADGLEACQGSWCFTCMQQSSWHSSLSEPKDEHHIVHAYNNELARVSCCVQTVYAFYGLQGKS